MHLCVSDAVAAATRGNRRDLSRPRLVPVSHWAPDAGLVQQELQLVTSRDRCHGVAHSPRRTRRET